MNRTWMTAAMAGVILLGLVAGAQAASISYVGLDETTNGKWGSTGVAKPFDADHYYGTDGWLVDYNTKASSYATITHVGRFFEWNYGPTQIDDPSYVPDVDATSVTLRKAFSSESGTNNIWSAGWTIELTQDASFGMALIVDLMWGNMAFGPQGVRVYLQGDPGSAVTATDSVKNNNDTDYVLYNLSGSAGDVFVVELQNDGQYSHTAGLMLDPAYVVVPEPATMSLVALGAVAALVRRRRR